MPRQVRLSRRADLYTLFATIGLAAVVLASALASSDAHARRDGESERVMRQMRRAEARARDFDRLLRERSLREARRVERRDRTIRAHEMILAREEAAREKFAARSKFYDEERLEELERRHELKNEAYEARRERDRLRFTEGRDRMREFAAGAARIDENVEYDLSQ